jgi:hypothetical protein
MDFLANAVPADVNNPFDLTFLVTNAAISDNTGWSLAPTFNFSCLEFYQATFDFNQTITNLPAGTYKTTVQAFQRPGAYATAYSDYVNGIDRISTLLYANTNSVKVAHIGTEASTSKLGGSEVSVGDPARYIPDNMEAASKYFAKGLYTNEVMAELTSDGQSLKIGLRCTSSSDGYWTIFDNFRLYYYGVPELVLDETSEKAPSINRTFDEVTLKRTIKPDTWSTFVAPFDIPASSLSGWEVKELTGSELKGNIISLVFSDAQDGIKSGVPYMVRNKQISSPLTEIVAYDAAVSTTFKHAETEHVVFTGVYHNGNIPQGAYFISDNTFYRAADNSNKIKGYRAYIMPKSGLANVNEVNFRWDGETSLQEITEDSDAEIKAIYTANGIPVSQPQRGINILKMSDGTTRKIFVK